MTNTVLPAVPARLLTCSMKPNEPDDAGDHSMLSVIVMAALFGVALAMISTSIGRKAFGWLALLGLFSLLT